MKKTIGIALGLSLAAGCGGKGGGSNGPSVSFTGSSIVIDTGKFTVPAGESLTCIYTGVETPQDFSIQSSAGHQSAGGHHVITYYSSQSPTVSVHPCLDTEMLNWQFVAGAGADGQVIQYLPAGIDLKIPGHNQLVLQSHYINTSGAPMEVDDQMTLNLIDPSQVQAYAAPFAVIDAGFTVPPNSVPYEHSQTCTVSQDLQIAMMLGHEHTSGTHFNLSLLGTGSAGTPTVLYDTPWQPSYMSHPPIQLYPMSAPLKLKGGSQLKITCDWLNSTSSAMQFPTEMCVSFMYYWPDTGNGMIVCGG